MNYSNLKVVILTEAGGKSGFGHAFRCSSLYWAFKKLGYTPTLIIDKDPTLGTILEEEKPLLINWTTTPSIIPKKYINADITIIDSYKATLEDYEYLSSQAKVPVFLDDTKRITYPKGVIINPALTARDLNYSTDSDHIYLLGPSYALLRPQFWRVKPNKVQKKLSSLLITFGSIDYENLIPQLLKELCHFYPMLHKKVIVGSTSPNLDSIKRLTDSTTELLISPNPKQIIQAIKDTDLAICSGGQTLMELARIGVPAVVIQLAKNQSVNISGWEEEGFIDVVGWFNQNNLNNKIILKVESLKDYQKRHSMSIKGSSVIDGQGCLRVATSLISMVNKDV